MNLKLSLIIVLVGLPLITLADTLQDADSTYIKGDYVKAAELYERVLSDGGESAGVYANLGSAAYHNGDYSTAVVSLARARRLAPGDKQIKSNLKFIDNKIVDANKIELKGKKGKVEPDSPTFLQSVKDMIAYDHTSDSWAGLAVMAFLLLLGMVALYNFSSRIPLKKLGFFSSFILLGFSVIFVIFALIAANGYETHDKGVLLSKTILMSAPDDGAKESSSPLVKGTTVTLLEEKVTPGAIDKWYKVRLNSENIGWVRQTDVEII